MKKIISVVLVLVLALDMVADVANADFTFGEPTNLGPVVNSSAYDEEPGISADGLSIYFCSRRAGGYGAYDMWVTNRATTQDDWGPPVNLGSTVNTSYDDFSEDISADGLELYFGSNRPGGSSYDIWVSKRATMQDDWTTPVNLGPMVNSSSWEGCPAISDDGLELYFWSSRPGGSGSYDIWVSRRSTTQDDWGMAVNLGASINSSAYDLCTDVSPDGLLLIFVSARSGGYGGRLGDLWMSRRPAINAPWGSPVNLGPIVNSPNDENGPCISADGSTLYFSSKRRGTADMWQATIDPVLDFNGDGILDIDDLVMLIENWNTDQSLCDIGPMPWGDGIVNEADLEVLMSCWGKDWADPTLIAHWKLDETEGMIANDSAGENDADLYGDPIWRPTDGMVDGALMLDGIDDLVATYNILNLSAGQLSVFAWVKGGAPGQVVVSQCMRVNWLMADASHGYLKTDLKGAGRITQSLVSEVTITDGNWHRVGLTWDGTNRILYVDNVAVASDTQSDLERSAMGLNIGCGPYETSGTFFAGLIDDVRIYNRAITP